MSGMGMLDDVIQRFLNNAEDGDFCRLIQVTFLTNDVHPDAEVVCSFIGATPGSADIRTLLEDVSRTIDSAYNLQIENAGTAYEDLVKHFPTRLAAATPDKPLIVMLDGLDQLSDANNAQSLAWLPAAVPENCRVLVSTGTKTLQEQLFFKDIPFVQAKIFPGLKAAAHRR